MVSRELVGLCTAAFSRTHNLVKSHAVSHATLTHAANTDTLAVCTCRARQLAAVALVVAAA